MLNMQSIEHLLTQEISAADLAKSLDDVMYEYATDRMAGHEGGPQSTNNLYCLRLMRDALQKVKEEEGK